VNIINKSTRIRLRTLPRVKGYALMIMPDTAEHLFRPVIANDNRVGLLPKPDLRVVK